MRPGFVWRDGCPCWPVCCCWSCCGAAWRFAMLNAP